MCLSEMSIWKKILRRLGLVTIGDYQDCRNAFELTHAAASSGMSFEPASDWLDCRLHNASLLCDYGTATYKRYNEFQRMWWETYPQ